MAETTPSEALDLLPFERIALQDRAYCATQRPPDRRLETSVAERLALIAEVRRLQEQERRMTQYIFAALDALEGTFDPTVREACIGDARVALHRALSGEGSDRV